MAECFNVIDPSSVEIANKVSSLLLMPIDPDDIDKNKQFGNLLLDLCEHLIDGNGNFMISKEETQAEEALKQARATFFEQQIIYDTLQEIAVNEIANNTFDSNENKVFCKIAERLRSVEISKYLEDIQNEVKLLDLTSNFVMETTSQITEKEVKQIIIPKLEEAIVKKCKFVLEYYGIETSDKLYSSQINQFPAILDTEIKNLESEKMLLAKDAIERLFITQNYYKILTESIDVLEQLLFKHKYGSHLNYYSTKIDYLSNKAHGLLQKLRILEMKLLCETYTKEAIDALKVIRNKLLEEEDKVKTELKNGQTTLDMYEKLGPNFFNLANEYTRLLKEIENKKWALKNLCCSEDNQ